MSSGSIGKCEDVVTQISSPRKISHFQNDGFINVHLVPWKARVDSLKMCLQPILCYLINISFILCLHFNKKTVLFYVFPTFC